MQCKLNVQASQVRYILGPYNSRSRLRITASALLDLVQIKPPKHGRHCNYAVSLVPIHHYLNTCELKAAPAIVASEIPLDHLKPAKVAPYVWISRTKCNVTKCIILWICSDEVVWFNILPMILLSMTIRERSPDNYKWWKKVWLESIFMICHPIIRKTSNYPSV